MATQSGSYDFKAAKQLDTSLDQIEVFNRLTNNSANEGVYLENGRLYVNASMIQTGTLSADRILANSISISKLSGSIENGDWNIDLTNGTLTIGDISANNISGGILTLGGNNNTEGTLLVKDASGTTIGTWDKDGITAANATFTGSLETSNGAIEFDGYYITFDYNLVSTLQNCGIRYRYTVNNADYYQSIIQLSYFNSNRPYMSIGSDCREIEIGANANTVSIPALGANTASITDLYVSTSANFTCSIRVRGTDTIGTTPSSNYYSPAFNVTDSNNTTIGYFNHVYYTNGTLGIQLGSQRSISGSTKYNTLILGINTSGNATVSVNGTGVASAWRSAIGLPSDSSWTACTVSGTGTVYVAKRNGLIFIKGGGLQPGTSWTTVCANGGIPSAYRPPETVRIIGYHGPNGKLPMTVIVGNGGNVQISTETAYTSSNDGAFWGVYYYNN